MPANAMMQRYRPIALSCLVLALLLATIFVEPLQQTTHQPDENGMYEQNGYWVQYRGDYNEQSALAFCRKLESLADTLLTPENRRFYALIPDKSHYLPKEGWPVLDFSVLQQTVRQELRQDFTEISLSDALTLESYYKTDGHWRQETLQPVVNALGDAMDFSVDLSGWTTNTYDSFVGSYRTYLSNLTPESLVYLTSSATESATVENLQTPDVHTVYDIDRLTSKQAYDVFLSGATPLVTITNPNAATQRELIIFRDSYASSLAPLLCDVYQTITLIDIRYMISGLVPQYVTFTNQDVLFLYSSWVVNQSAMLR